MNTVWAAKKGFTIIELLVVMVVIGILVTITVVSYSGLQQRSRDSERASDITQIKIAIEKYHSDKSGYPRVCSTDNTACAITSLSAALAPYLATIPRDPQYATTPANDYVYVQSAVVDDGYAILIHYEAKSMCKTGSNVVAGWWGVAVPICS